MAAATVQSPQIINIKWLHSNGDYRRFLLEVTDYVDIYELLLQKIRTVIPGFEGSLAWQDEDGDTIVFSSHIEMQEAIALPCNRDLFRIYTLEDAPKKSEKQEKKTGEEDASKKSDKHDKKNREEKKSGTKEKHIGIVCDKCDKEIVGIRYKCTVCNDYDLCEKCERHGYHAEHPMVRYVTPVDRVNSSSSSRSSSHSANSPQFIHMHCGGWGGGRGSGRGCGRGGFHPHTPGFRTPFGTASVFTGFMPPPPNVPAADMATRAADIAVAASQAAAAAAQRATNTLLQNMMGPNHGPTYPTRPQQPQQQPQAQQPQQQQQQQQQTGGQQQQQPQQPQQQPQQTGGQTGGQQTQEDPSQQFRESFANGFDYLREIGQQVQQALANFGIEVDMDIEHGDVREHVPRDSTQNNNNNNDNTSTGSARNGTTTTTTTTTKAPEEAATKKQQCENVTNEANEHIGQHQSTEEMEQQPNDVVAPNEQQKNTETVNTDITEPNVNEVVGVPLKRMHISEEAAMEEHQLPLERSNLNATNAEDADTAILVDIADDDGNTWTMMDNAETTVVNGSNNSNRATAAQPQVYPNLSDPGIRCMAGTPFIQAPQGPHNPHCSIIHADKRIASCVQQLESMGFDNCNGWLIKLAIENGGDTARVIEEAAKDPIYVQRLQSAL